MAAAMWEALGQGPGEPFGMSEERTAKAVWPYQIPGRRGKEESDDY